MHADKPTDTERNLCSDSKAEIAEKPLHTRREKAAFLSALFVTAGSLLIHGENIAVTLSTRNTALAAAVRAASESLGGRQCRVESDGHNRTIVVENALPLLKSCKVLAADGETITVCERIATEWTEDTGAAAAYVRGAYLGSGSLSIAKYHLEFSFSRKSIAEDFVALLAQFGIAARCTERKDRMVVYGKDSQQISDCLALMGAGKAVLRFNSVVVERQMNGNINRQQNCDLHNIDKQVDTSLKQCAYLRELDLQSLSAALCETARARLDHPEMSYEQLAAVLGVSKSGVKNRLRRLQEIYDKNKGEQGK